MAPPRATHCKRGHLIAAIGRTKSGTCRECNKVRRRHEANEILLISAAPFRRWLRDRNTETPDMYELSRGLGISETRVRRILGGVQRSVHIDTVDRALCRDGRFHLRELYPDLYIFPDE